MGFDIFPGTFRVETLRLYWGLCGIWDCSAAPATTRTDPLGCARAFFARIRRTPDTIAAKYNTTPQHVPTPPGV